jgi:predicted small integral membrane protein
MMEPADPRNLNDDTHIGWLHLSGHWRILVQRLMTTGIVIVGDIGSEYATERFLAEHNHMTQALWTNGADEPFDIWRLLPVFMVLR